MGASIGDYLVIEAKAEEDFVKKKGCNSFCSDGFLCGAENYPFSKPMVDHNQKFVLLANSTTIDIFTNKESEARPPEFGGNQLTDFEIARMASSLVVMTSDKNSFPKGEVGGHIDIALVGKDSLGMLPVREMGVEGRRNRPFH